MKISDMLLQQEGLSMAHDGATYCGTRGEYTFLILMGRNELVVSVLRGGEEPDKEIQKKWFVAQLDLARRLKLPVIIHSRDAAKDTLDIMKAEHGSDIGGVIHCFSYTKEMAREYLDMGFFLGIGGVLTFKNARKLVETVEYAPLDRLVLETDCPYLSPVPNRGKRNSSLNLTYVADQLAALKGVDRETVEKMTWDNARKLYRL